VAQLVDDDGSPLANHDYKLTLPDGTVKTGQTDAQGYIRVQIGQQTGNSKLELPGYKPASGS
jgi:uncharacterized protein (DUF2345 family)